MMPQTARIDDAGDGTVPAAPAREAWPPSGRLRFAAAACASVLLHWVLLAAYDPLSPNPDALFGATWSRPFEATLRPPPASAEAPGTDVAPQNRSRFAPPAGGTRPGSRSDAAGNAEAALAQAASPAAPAQAGGSASAADASPRIDLEAALRYARQLARAEAQSRAAQAGRREPAAMERETPLGRAIAASVRPDCRSAYAGAGLFAIPALIMDALTDRGCGW